MKPKPFAFVLMPFAEKFDDVYKLGIKAACDEAGAYSERVDEQVYTERMLDRIYNQIQKADLLIADVTDRNPNVFYEIGYAHALGRNVILLTQDTKDIPFDLQHHFHIVYRGKITKLKEELTKRVTWLIANPAKQEDLLFNNLEVWVNDKALNGAGNIPVVSAEGHLTLSVGNSPKARILTSNYKLGVTLPAACELFEISSRGGGLGPRLEGFPADKPGTFIHLLPATYTLLPGEWARSKLFISSRSNHTLAAGPHPCAVRLFLESGPVDYEFSIVS